MKATLLYATFALVLGSPVAFSKSEVETLRDRVSVQEKEIAKLSAENARLKGSKETKPAAETRVASPAPADERPEKAEKAGTYTVRSGDTLERIARKTGNSVASLGKANNIQASTIIHPGLVLKLPAGSKTAVAASRPIEKADAKPTPAVARKTEPKPEVAKAEPKSEPKADDKEKSKLASRTPAASETKTISNPKPTPAPAPAAKSEAKSEALAENAKAPTTGGAGGSSKPVIRSIIIQNETSYGAFASQHGTTADRLNDLNGLSLSTSTVLAKGSELYIPAQP